MAKTNQPYNAKQTTPTVEKPVTTVDPAVVTTDATVSVATGTTPVDVATTTVDATAIVTETPVATATVDVTATETPVVEVAPVVTETIQADAATAVATPTTPVADVTAAVASVTPTVSDFAAIIGGILDTGTATQKQTIWRMEDYINKMRPGVTQTEQSGTQNQLTFWHFLNSTINLDQAEFKQCWAIILFYFKEYNKGALGEQYVARFFNAIRLDEASMKAFQHLLDLCSLTADAGTRAQAMRQMDLNRALSVGISEQAKANIISFYS